MTTTNAGCCEWKGKRNANGYGIVFINGKQLFVHRLAVALSGRDIPKNKVCDHLCRNHACYNPDHIELVTQAVNNLRGESIPARHARSVTCSKGHPYTKENTRVWTDTRGRISRHCKHCYADREYANKRKRGVISGKRNASRPIYGN